MESVSVIIPIYNGADLIGAALESVASQSRPPEEVIVVDDASTDDSIERVEHWKIAHPDLNVQIIRNDVNKGAPGSRKIGLNAATSDWILFLDMDDLLDLRQIEIGLKLGNEDIDAIIYGVRHFSHNTGKELRRVGAGNRRLSGKEALAQFCKEQWGAPYLWNKMWRSEVIRSSMAAPYTSSYVDSDYWVDSDYEVVFGAYLQCRAVVSTDDAWHGYRRHDGSMSSTFPELKHYIGKLNSFANCLECHARDDLWLKEMARTIYMRQLEWYYDPQGLDFGSVEGELREYYCSALRRIAICDPDSTIALLELHHGIARDYRLSKHLRDWCSRRLSKILPYSIQQRLPRG